MTIQFRIALFLAALSLLFVASCWNLGRYVGESYRSYKDLVAR